MSVPIFRLILREWLPEITLYGHSMAAYITNVQHCFILEILFMQGLLVTGKFTLELFVLITIKI